METTAQVEPLSSFSPHRPNPPTALTLPTPPWEVAATVVPKESVGGAGQACEQGPAVSRVEPRTRCLAKRRKVLDLQPRIFFWGAREKKDLPEKKKLERSVIVCECLWGTAIRL